MENGYVAHSCVLSGQLDPVVGGVRLYYNDEVRVWKMSTMDSLGGPW